MAEDWFDEMSQPPAPEREPAPGEQEVSGNDGSSKTSTEEQKPEHKRRKWIPITGVFVLITIAAGSVAFLVNSSNNKAVEATSAGENEAVDIAVEATDQDSAIGVAGECEPEDGEVEIAADDHTVRGAVAQWQSAYYSRDVPSLEAAIAPESWLLENEWNSILAEAAPGGTNWCAVMSPTTGDSVDVDVMVTFPDGDSEIYPQTVSGVSDGEHWLIEDITSREG